MALTGTDYRQQLQSLLPQGSAWPRAALAVWTSLLDAVAQEFARVDGHSRGLVDEADPRTTTELLGDWERVAGLPDGCSGLLAETQQARRNDLVSKLVGRGGQSRAYFIEVAAAFGFEVSIDEFRPFCAGISAAGDELTNGDWIFTWRVRAPAVTVVPFRAGISAAGEPVASWGNAGLECRIRQNKPAHTNVIFAYGDNYISHVLLLPDGDPFITPDGLGLSLE